MASRFALAQKQNGGGGGGQVRSCASLFVPPPPWRAALGQWRQNTVQRVTSVAAVRFRCARRNSAVINSAKPQKNRRLSLGGQTLLRCPHRLAVRPQSGGKPASILFLFYFFPASDRVQVGEKSLFAVTYFLASAFSIRQDFLGRSVSENRQTSSNGAFVAKRSDMADAVNW